METGLLDQVAAEEAGLAADGLKTGHLTDQAAATGILPGHLGQTALIVNSYI